MNRASERHYAQLSFFLIVLFSLPFYFGPVTQAYAVPYQLVVNGGAGGGAYEPSTVIYISAFPYDTGNPATSNIEPADPAANVRIFSGWSGDTATVSDIREKDTTLIMPSQNITVTAQFKDAARWKPPRMITSFPEIPIGVIYLFHGYQSGVADLLSSLEISRFVDQAVSRNFGVVMIESYDRKKEQWDVDHTGVADNIDMARLGEVHKRLVSKGTISANTPVYLVGISQGGFFATRVAAEAGRGTMPFTVRAAAVYICPGSRTALAETSAPTIFIIARNDTVMDNGWALSDFDLLIGRGIATQLWIHEPAPVHPDKFWGIPGLSQTDSQLLQSGLKAKQMLDPQNFLLAAALEDGNGDGSPDWMAAIPAGYAGYLPEISRQLRAANANHAFFSDLHEKTFAFFKNPTTVINLVPAITGFSPASGDVGTLVTVTGDNFVDIQSVTFNGKPAPHVRSSPKTLKVIVPFGATTGPIQITNSAGTAVSPGVFAVGSAGVTGGHAP